MIARGLTTLVCLIGLSLQPAKVSGQATHNTKLSVGQPGPFQVSVETGDEVWNIWKNNQAVREHFKGYIAYKKHKGLARNPEYFANYVWLQNCKAISQKSDSCSPNYFRSLRKGTELTIEIPARHNLP